MSWVACYAAPSAPEAHLVKGFLEQRGVPCLVREQGASMYPAPALGGGAHVLVPADWLAVARKMVDRRRHRRPARVVPLRRVRTAS